MVARDLSLTLSFGTEQLVLEVISNILGGRRSWENGSLFCALGPDNRTELTSLLLDRSVYRERAWIWSSYSTLAQRAQEVPARLERESVQPLVLRHR